jgi:phage terminase small subunit
MLAIYCDAWQTVSNADAEIARSGEYFYTEKGYCGIHPAVTRRNDAIALILRTAAALGIGVRSRKGLKGGKPAEVEEDELENF